MNTHLERLDPLTPREREVFRLVVSGMLNKQVAYDLGITEKTVKVHRAQVMQKMHAQTLADLVRFAEKLGIRVSTDERNALDQGPISFPFSSRYNSNQIVCLDEID